MGPEARLDMRDRHARRETGQSRTERARSVSLDHEQCRPWGKPRKQRLGDGTDVAMRVLLAGAVEPFGAKSLEAERRRVEVRVLAGEDQLWSDPSLGERMGKGGKLDRFGPGPDHEPYIDAIQPSP